MRGENSSELGYCILGVAGKLLEVLKNFFFFVPGRNWTGGVGVATWLRLGLKGLRSRHEIHVVTWGKRFEVATWSGQREVTTRNGRRDLGGLTTGGLVSRPRFEVTTWSVLGGVATSI